MEPISVIVWTYVSVFAATAFVTVGGVVENSPVKVREPYLRGLYATLILEVVAGAIVIASQALISQKDCPPAIINPFKIIKPETNWHAFNGEDARGVDVYIQGENINGKHPVSKSLRDDKHKANFLVRLVEQTAKEGLIGEVFKSMEIPTRKVYITKKLGPIGNSNSSKYITQLGDLPFSLKVIDLGTSIGNRAQYQLIDTEENRVINNRTYTIISQRDQAEFKIHVVDDRFFIVAVRDSNFDEPYAQFVAAELILSPKTEL